MYHEGEALILFTFPLIGLLLHRSLPRKKAYWIIGIASILFLPFFFLYQYPIHYVFRILLLTITSVVFGLYLQTLKKRSTKVALSLVLSVILFFLLISTVIDDLGTQRVKKTWHVKNYRIEYIEDRAFGEVGWRYDLSKYSLIPLLFKKVDAIRASDTATSCLVEFPETGIAFDKCNRVIRQKTPQPRSEK
jgi:hypothetical protein